MSDLAQQLVNGLLIGCVYSLIAMGLTLIWGVMNIVNFAHGDFLMLSMFVSFWLYTLWGIDPLFSLPVNALLLFALGVLVYRYAVSRVMRGPLLAQLVVTFGVSIFLANSAVMMWTPDFRLIEKPLLAGTWNLGGVPVSIPKLVASLGSVVVALGLLFFLRRTRAGKAILATDEPGLGPAHGHQHRSRERDLVRHRVGAGGDRGELPRDVLLHLPAGRRALRDHLLRHRCARRLRQRVGGVRRGDPHRPGADHGRLLL